TDEIRTFTWQMIDFLMEKQIKLLVIACNTATAVVIEEARKTLPIPVIGVIRPGSVAALKSTQKNHIAVIGTTGTVNSGAYERELITLNKYVQVESLACPMFVPLVEQGNLNSEEPIKKVTKSLLPLQNSSSDTLILGCTHYPLLSQVIQKVVGNDKTLISSGEETAKEVEAILFENSLQYNGPKRNIENCSYTTSDTEMFKKIGEDWLEIKMSHLEKIQLSQYVSV